MPIPDLQNHCGKWLQEPRMGGKAVVTYSGCRWKALRQRCGYTEDNLPRNPLLLHYVGITNDFRNFQHFVDWIRGQKGYPNEGWQVDKDLLQKGNKVYSENTCLLLPKELNLIALKRKFCRGDTPIGVTLEPNGKFKASLSGGSCDANIYLGVFETPDEAFSAYKEGKESFIKQQAEKWRDKIDPRAYNALMNYQVEITD